MYDRLIHARWWLAYPTLFVLLAILDSGLAFWHPRPLRLPEQFSPGYLALYLSDVPRDRPALVLLGDSVLWGYKLAPDRTVASLLQRRFPNVTVLNLSYEGGSTPNSAVMLREVLRAGIPVAAVVANINSKEFNAADSAYATLHPSLEREAFPVLTRSDRSTLVFHEATDLNARLNDLVERIWRLYRLRTDIRESLFGSDDMAGALVALAHRMTGETATESAMHRPTADRFLGTYDLTPIDDRNVGMTYYKTMIAELCKANIPALLFLTPTNHALLHEYIDSPDYAANLRRLASIARCRGVRVENLDRAIPAAEFIDNDHLTEPGQIRLENALAPFVGSIL